jgi:hypothetical protein
MEKLFNILTAMAAVVLAVFLIGLVISYPFMLLWNYCLVPAVTVLTEVTWLQAYGILVASGFMFKSTSVSNKKD